jgi:AcrR family transcriptional regulator
MAKETTKDRLIVAAEQLFGARGLNGVTLKEITLAAGQRNESALHYHFGSKENLIEEIFKRRTKFIDGRRLELLKDLEKKEAEPTIRQNIEVSIRPFLELLEDLEDGASYLHFLAQLLSDPRYDLAEISLSADLPGIAQITQRLIEAHHRLPDAALTIRRRAIIALINSTLHDWSQNPDLRLQVSLADLGQYVVDLTLGLIMTPANLQINVVSPTQNKKTKTG